MPEPTRSTQEPDRPMGTSPGSPTTARSTREGSSGVYGEYGGPEGSSRMDERMGEMRRGAGEAYGRAGQGLTDTWEQAMDYSREHPGRSTLIAFGVGVGVGMLVASGFATRNRTRRIVPPVMNALSEIASEIFR